MSKKERVTSILENDVIAKRLKYLDRLVDENIS
jgi:DNA recombination-dependent growth factor C